jgi:hypothetical protein
MVGRFGFSHASAIVSKGIGRPCRSSASLAGETFGHQVLETGAAERVESFEALDDLAALAQGFKVGQVQARDDFADLDLRFGWQVPVGGDFARDRGRADLTRVAHASTTRLDE